MCLSKLVARQGNPGLHRNLKQHESQLLSNNRHFFLKMLRPALPSYSILRMVVQRAKWRMLWPITSLERAQTWIWWPGTLPPSCPLRYIGRLLETLPPREISRGQMQRCLAQTHFIKTSKWWIWKTRMVSLKTIVTVIIERLQVEINLWLQRKSPHQNQETQGGESSTAKIILRHLS